MTEVYEVNLQRLSAPDLAAKLASYFADNEQKEIQRIADLVKFFELDKCLNRSLSAYFDDTQAPAQCGHCSVCMGKVAKLTYSTPIAIPDKHQVAKAMAALKAHLKDKGDMPLTESIYCRFLTRMTMPLFTRLKIKHVAGYGCCEHCRYGDVKTLVASLLG